MPNTLLIHYNPSLPAPATWSLVNDSGELTSKISTGTLSDIDNAARQHRAVVLLDNTLVHINRVSLPVQNPQKLLRAIPFALEEDIVDDIEDMHFVAAKAVKDQPTAIAGIHRQQLDAILTALSDASISVDMLIPDSICLSANSEQWCALFDGNEVNLQTSALNGNVYDADLFESVISTALKNADANPPKKLLVFFKEGEPTPDTSSLSDDDLGVGDLEIINVQYNTHPLVVYCSNYKQSKALNLLQHEYKPQRKGAFNWRKWRVAASLAAVWLTLSLGITGYQLHQTKQKNTALKSEIIGIYKSAFPKSKRTFNPKSLMKQKLNELKTNGAGSGSGMVALIASSSQALAEDTSISLQSINFRNGRLDLAVNSKDLGAIQSLNNRLNKTTGIKSEIVSSSSEQNQVKASLRVQRKTS